MSVMMYGMEGEIMNKVKLYLKYRQKSYLLKTALFIIFFIVAIFIFGPPNHYVVPIFSIIAANGILEFLEYKS